MSVALGANIALPIDSALSYRMPFDDMGVVPYYGKLGAVWTPAALFAAGEQGAWYDPSDLTTMFQDSAGTTPVTADGQPVGKILDKSGRGNHASQTTAAARPLYKTDGTYHWLLFDGAGDYLESPSVSFTGYHMAVFKGIMSTVSASVGFSELVGDSGAQGRMDAYFVSTGETSAELVSGGLVNPVSIAVGASTKAVLTTAANILGAAASDRISIRKNGTLPAQSASGPSLSNQFGNNRILIGGLASSYSFSGAIYSLIVRGALITSDEITATETWVNSKTGAY